MKIMHMKANEKLIPTISVVAISIQGLPVTGQGYSQGSNLQFFNLQHDVSSFKVCDPERGQNTTDESITISHPKHKHKTHTNSKVGTAV